MPAIVTKIFGFVSPYLLKIAIGAAIAAVLYFLYSQHVNKIEQAALGAFNRTQLEQVVKDQQATNEQLKMIAEQQAIILGQLQARNLELQEQFNSIDQYLRSEAAKAADRAASEVLKETIERLRKQQK